MGWLLGGSGRGHPGCWCSRVGSVVILRPLSTAIVYHCVSVGREEGGGGGGEGRGGEGRGGEGRGGEGRGGEGRGGGEGGEGRGGEGE